MPRVSSPRCAGGLQQIERNVRLALMMALVPGNNLQRLADAQAALLESRGNSSQIGLGQLRDGLPQVLTRSGQHVANHRQRRDIVVRRTPASESRHEVGKGRRRAEKAL